MIHAIVKMGTDLSAHIPSSVTFLAKAAVPALRSAVLRFPMPLQVRSPRESLVASVTVEWRHIQLITQRTALLWRALRAWESRDVGIPRT